MSVNGFQDILGGPFAKYLQLSKKIGGDVAQQADLVNKAFNAQLAFIQLAATSSQPAQAQLTALLKPTSEQISATQDFREKHRTSPFFNHLSAISESIPALGWVCIAPTPGPHVKEMNDAGQFYTNRVLKDWKEKDTTHVEWARSWVQTLSELQQFIKQHHTTGLVWSGKSAPSAAASQAGISPSSQNGGVSVYGFQDILGGPFAQYLQLSKKIGGDVAQQADLVNKAFNAQLAFIQSASSSSQPAQAQMAALLKPTSDQISAIQDFREKHRTSPFFNHLSAISESIPALGWVCIAPTPGPHVKEMNDAGQFYTNRVLKDWKEKDAAHVEWARSWVQTLTDLQQYIKQHHTTGLVWSGKSAPSIPPPPACGPPPPPPPVLPPLGDLSLGASGADDGRNALFAQINQGEDITKSLKRVTADMQTHKNAALRSGPAPFKAPTAVKPVANPTAKPAAPAKPPSFTRDGKKWLIEYQKGATDLVVENAEMNNVVYVFRCENSTITVKGKINSIFLDSCKKCSVVFDTVVSSIEFVNCQSVQMQVLGHVPTISIDKTDGCQMYLSEQSKNVEIISSKSSEMNVLLPKGGDYTEHPIPEQFKTTIGAKGLNTICVESLG